MGAASGARQRLLALRCAALHAQPNYDARLRSIPIGRSAHRRARLEPSHAVPLRVGRRTIAQKSVRLKPFMEASLRKQSLAFELLSSLIPVISPRSVGLSVGPGVQCLNGRVATAALPRWHACTAGNCCGNLAIGPGGVKRTQGYSTVLNATPWARVALLRAFTPAAHWQRRIRIRISDSHSRAAALPALAAVSGSALRR